MIWVRAVAMLDSKSIGLKPVICIAGPTASGKSGAAIELAKMVGGEIVNADALQVYRDIQLLSARPTKAEMQGIPHHLFGHVEGRQLYSVGDWSREAVPILLDILARGCVPILTGGTGLYFQSLLQGLADIPLVPRELDAALNSYPIEQLREDAQRLDPVATDRVLGDDPQRLARIVGVARSTGRPLSAWQADTKPIIPTSQTQRFVLFPERQDLYARINQRFDRMIEAGALEEARQVHAKSYPSRASLPKAIGLSHLLSYLSGDGELATSIEAAKRDSRRLAKRQMTWFRNRCADWTFCDTPESLIQKYKDGF